ncbi:hypothetical protein RB195_014895 [Necator americanus]|uniref:SCP domain-containing protein n=1 Tax=Necator americanus TaxID=51031 RepID=A0ABR1E237_NECAM
MWVATGSRSLDATRSYIMCTDWDCMLEQEAQKVVDKCDATASGPAEVSMVIGKLPVKTCNPVTLIKKQVDAWWNTVKNAAVDSTNPTYSDSKLHDFAVLAYGSAVKLGCAQKNCNGELVMACMLYPKGPEDGQPIYEVGGGCTKLDPNDVSSYVPCSTYQSSTCATGTKLCVAGYIDPNRSTTTAAATTVATTTKTEAATTTKTEAATTTTAGTTAGGVASTICTDQANWVMSTDAVRNKFVDSHNEYRSIFAKGQGVMSGGVTARPCSQMKKMKYDCASEKIAYNAACSATTGYVENRNSFQDPNKDPVQAAMQAVRRWYNEKQTGSLLQQTGQTNTYAENLGIPRFAKVVWDTHATVGCAVKPCGGKLNVVCVYNPSNFGVGKQIYKMGPTCNRCTGSCDSAMGLCL